MIALLVAIRIPEPDPALDAEFRSAGSDPPPRWFGLLLRRHGLARERLKRTAFVRRIGLSGRQAPS